MIKLVAVKEGVEPTPALAKVKARRQRATVNKTESAGVEELEPTAQITEEFEVEQDAPIDFTHRTETLTARPSRPGGKRKMNQPSKLQTRIFDFIDEFIEEHNGLPPTVREIQEKLNISSTSVVDYNLKALEQKGFISRNRKQSRGVVLLNRNKTVRAESIPLLGVIAAGQPIPNRADVTTEDTVDVPPYMLNSRPGPDVFALRVKGESMIDALIADGDIVLIKQQATAEIGETVAVWLESEEQTTLKKWYPEPSQNRVRLQPANTTMDPIYTALSNVRVMGKLVGVIRTLA